MSQNRAYTAANAKLQQFKRSTSFRRAVGELSRLAWIRRKAASPRLTQQSLRRTIRTELAKLL